MALISFPTLSRAQNPGEFRGDRIALRVNSEVLTAGQVESVFLRAGVGPTSSTSQRSAALRGLVDFLLLRQISKDEDVTDVESELWERARDVFRGLRNQYNSDAEFRQALALAGTDPDGMRQQLFEQEQHQERILRHVSKAVQSADLVSPQPTAKQTGAVRLRRFGLKVRKGETTAPIRLQQMLADSILQRQSFTELVKQHSEVPDARKDEGELGWIEVSDLAPELQSAVQATRSGMVTAPVRAGQYWCLFQVVERATPGGQGKRGAYEAARERLLTQQRRRARIEVLSPELRGLSINPQTPTSAKSNNSPSSKRKPQDKSK